MDLKPGDEFAGYRIQAVLGQGGFGTVYRAFQVQLRRDVALKIMRAFGDPDPIALKRFRREIELQMQLSHPNLVTVYDGGSHEGLDYLAMEIVAGGNLQERIREVGVPEMAAGLRTFLEIARAVEFLHENGVTHRDIKPLNVLLSAGGQMKLTDFGLARADHHTLMTRASAVLGTPRYIAPEILNGDGAGAPSDVFSLGVLAYLVLTTKFPFPAESYGEYLQAIATREPVAIRELRPDIPLEAGDALMSMLAKNPGKRPSAQEIVKILEAHSLVGGPVRIVTGATRPGAEAVDPMAVTPRKGARRTKGTPDSQQRRTVTTAPPVGAGRGRRGLIVAGLLASVLGAAFFAAWKRTPGDMTSVTSPGPRGIVPSVEGTPLADPMAASKARKMRTTLFELSLRLRARMVRKSEIEDTLILTGPEVDKGYFELSQHTHRFRQLLRDYGSVHEDDVAWLDLYDTGSELVQVFGGLRGTVRASSRAGPQHSKILGTIFPSLRQPGVAPRTLRSFTLRLLTEEFAEQVEEISPATAAEVLERPTRRREERRLDYLAGALARLESATSTDPEPERTFRMLAHRARLTNLVLNARYEGGATLYRLGMMPPPTDDFRKELGAILDLASPFVKDPASWKGPVDRLDDVLENSARAGICASRMDWQVPDRPLVERTLEHAAQLLAALPRVKDLPAGDRSNIERLVAMTRERLEPVLEKLGKP